MKIDIWGLVVLVFVVSALIFIFSSSPFFGRLALFLGATLIAKRVIDLIS